MTEKLRFDRAEILQQLAEEIQTRKQVYESHEPTLEAMILAWNLIRQDQDDLDELVAAADDVSKMIHAVYIQRHDWKVVAELLYGLQERNLRLHALLMKAVPTATNEPKEGL